MTKSDAIKSVMKDNNGFVTWRILYDEIEKYYLKIKDPKDWRAALRGVLYRDIQNKKIFKIGLGLFAIDETEVSKLEFVDEMQEIETTKFGQVSIRIGQNSFRKKLLDKLKHCPITYLDDRRLLVASHIKPWVFSNSKEKLDVYNGFLFSPLIDKLFDRGLITFNPDKSITYSPSLSKKNIANLKLENTPYSKLPLEGREGYLEFHRSKVFLNF